MERGSTLGHVVRYMMASGNVAGNMVAACGKVCVGSLISVSGLTSNQRGSVCTNGQMAAVMRAVGAGISEMAMGLTSLRMVTSILELTSLASWRAMARTLGLMGAVTTVNSRMD
jgi:hypothetical protein